MDTIYIGDKKCRVVESESFSRCILVGIDKRDVDTPQLIENYLSETSCDDYLVIFYEVADWFGDLSPWEYKMSEKEYFAGNGRKTLSWLENECREYIKNNYAIDKILLCGYSLSGLFSLWAFYESDIFCGAAGCSPSLWYKGWSDYSKKACASQPSVLYLSLGINEEKTKHKVMCQVGNEVRAQYERVCGDKNIYSHKLQWHKGGHFRDCEMRLAKGILWLCRN